MTALKHKGRVQRHVVPPELAQPLAQGERVVPEQYRADALDYFCEQIMLKRTVKDICADPLMPSEKLIARWLNSDSAFKARFIDAQRVRALIESGNLIDISDGSQPVLQLVGTTIDAAGEETKHYQVVSDTARDKLRVDTRLKVLSKLEPTIFGDKVAVAHDVGGELADMLKGAMNRGHRLPGAARAVNH